VAEEGKNSEHAVALNCGRGAGVGRINENVKSHSVQSPKIATSKQCGGKILRNQMHVHPPPKETNLGQLSEQLVTPVIVNHREVQNDSTCWSLWAFCI